MTGDQSSSATVSGQPSAGPPPADRGASQQRIPKKQKFTHIMMTDNAEGDVADRTILPDETVTVTSLLSAAPAADDEAAAGDSTLTSDEASKKVELNLKREEAPSRNDSPSTTLFHPPILRKGDLVRLSNE